VTCNCYTFVSVPGCCAHNTAALCVFYDHTVSAQIVVYSCVQGPQIMHYETERAKRSVSLYSSILHDGVTGHMPTR
jgi:hypothetical protein